MPAPTPRLRLALCGLLLSCVLVVPATAAAASTWTAPTTVRAGASEEQVRVATTADGATWVAWRELVASSGSIRVRRIAADGTLGSVTVVSNLADDAGHPVLSALPDGGAELAWVEAVSGDSTVQARRIHADGTLGSTQVVAHAVSNDADMATLGVDAAGNAWVAWRQQVSSTYEVHLRRIDAADELGSDSAVSNTVIDVQDPRIAVAPTGGLTVAWREGSSIWARTATGDGSLGEFPQTVANDGASPLVTRAIDGTSLVMWQHDGGPGMQEVLGQRLDMDGVALGSPLDISPTGMLSSPHLAGTPDGRSLVTWRLVDASPVIPELRRVGAAGELPAAGDLAEPATDATSPEVAVGTDGTGLVAWRSVGTNGTSLLARTVLAGTTGSSLDGAGPTATLSTSDDPLEVAVAMRGASSIGAVAWLDQLTMSIRVARLVPSPVAPSGPGTATSCPAGTSPGVACTTNAHGGIDVTGTDGPDVLVGTAGDDVLIGGGGSDRLYGGAGNDVEDGGAGNDVVRGGAGNDILSGSNDSDLLDGGSGRDTLRGNAGGDTLIGGAGDDRLLGGPGDDQLLGDSGRDRMWGEAGNDRLWGGTGSDMLDGGSGRDTLRGEGAADVLHGGLGADSFRGGAARDVLLDVHPNDTVVLGLDRTGDSIRHGA